jgi:hypothetical protein
LSLYLQSRAINFGRQGHSLTQSKKLHCKTVVNIITYHHVVGMTLIVIFFSFFCHFVDMGIIRLGNVLNLWQSNQILKWHWRPKFIARDSKYFWDIKQKQIKVKKTLSKTYNLLTYQLFSLNFQRLLQYLAC